MSSVARDSCGEGSDIYYQSTSKAIWKKFPIKVFIDESGYPGAESKEQARAGIKRVIDQVNYILGFSFFSIRLDRSICNLIIQFGPVSTGIGYSYYKYRYASPNETYFSEITLNNNTRWFINPYEQCYVGGYKYHMPATIAHEVGHSLGLAHNSTDKVATMRSYSSPGETLRETYGLSEKTFLHRTYDQFKPT